MNNIRLRSYQNDDIVAIVDNANNPNVAKYLRDVFPSPYTSADATWWVEQGSRLDGTLSYAIEHDNVLVGGIGATFFNDERRHSAEIGYWLGEKYWGKGITTEAVNQFAKELFRRDEIVRLFAPVADANLNSMRVLEKCGFEKEGVLKKALLLRGEFYDAHIFSKLK